MKIHVFSGSASDDDHETLYVDRVEGDAAFALAVIEAELTIEDGQLLLKLEARNTTNKPHVNFKFSVAESLDQPATETC
jgi:hypothetical protein